MDTKAFLGLWTPARFWVLLVILAVGLLANTSAHADGDYYRREHQHAEIITVENTNDSGPGSLRQAIANALPGDVISFAEDLDGETITLTSGELVIDKDLTITGLGADSLTISGNNSSRVFKIVKKVKTTISHLRITEGKALDGDGGGILNQGKLNSEDVTLGSKGDCRESVATGNDALYGGGIYNEGTVTMSNCTINCNKALEGAGILNFGTGKANLAECTIGSVGLGSEIKDDANDAQFGGGISNYGKATLEDCIVSGNNGQFGPAIFNGATGTVTVTECTISNHDGQFGAILSVGKATLNHTTIDANEAQFGGGLVNDGKGKMTLNNSTITDNSAQEEGDQPFGGGILNGSKLNKPRAATVKLKNTALANNMPKNCDGTGKFISQSGNSDTDGTCIKEDHDKEDHDKEDHDD
jgi:hypothetical protein